MKADINLVFPHQLFEKTPFIGNGNPTYIIEEWLFFKQYDFHQQKLFYHRASMKYYADFLTDNGIEQVNYIEANDERADIRTLIHRLVEDNHCQTIHYVNVVDDWLEQRIVQACHTKKIDIKRYQSPSFIKKNNDLKSFFRKDKKKYFLANFYKNERKRLGILLTDDQQPVGGQWSFDQDNRKKYPKNQRPPQMIHPKSDQYSDEAANYVKQHHSHNCGSLTQYPLYPHTHKDAKKWLEVFLTERFEAFGSYQDAIVDDQDFLHHSVLSPMINSGLLIPQWVVDRILAHCQDHDIPINAQEGLLRQIIGWREYIRGIYLAQGRFQRTHNYWQFSRSIPNSFYQGTTGIEPIDQTIKRALKTGYSHHIERLMVLGNFMVLCEFDPNQVYQWFMEMYIDAYDWVMVPNVYGMSQFADGGLMSTKPYISSSNYVLKMSNYKKGPWCEIWDALFWRFMHQQQDFFEKNARMSMLVRRIKNMDPDKKQHTLDTANAFLKQLDDENLT